ncbi:MAG TPA: universal stress protein [Thermoanaerobaculia bacterium]|nr:universal stress protein [Thermoanaerobaculia bacterium]
MRRNGLRILVAIDFSPESEEALRAARELSARTRARLTLVHVRPHSDIRAAILEERGDLLKGRAGSLRKAMARHYRERLESSAKGGRREALALRSGKPGRALLREVRGGYDLLVMGSRGRGGVAAALLGSTVQEVLTRSPVPVLRRGSASVRPGHRVALSGVGRGRRGDPSSAVPIPCLRRPYDETRVELRPRRIEGVLDRQVDRSRRRE